jgi:hypothetical protein
MMIMTLVMTITTLGHDDHDVGHDDRDAGHDTAAIMNPGTSSVYVQGLGASD